jgi:hypothetical protein
MTWDVHALRKAITHMLTRACNRVRSQGLPACQFRLVGERLTSQRCRCAIRVIDNSFGMIGSLRPCAMRGVRASLALRTVQPCVLHTAVRQHICVATTTSSSSLERGSASSTGWAKRVRSAPGDAAAIVARITRSAIACRSAPSTAAWRGRQAQIALAASGSVAHSRTSGWAQCVWTVAGGEPRPSCRGGACMRVMSCLRCATCFKLPATHELVTNV